MPPHRQPLVSVPWLCQRPGGSCASPEPSAPGAGAVPPQGLASCVQLLPGSCPRAPRHRCCALGRLSPPHPGPRAVPVPCGGLGGQSPLYTTAGATRGLGPRTDPCVASHSTPPRVAPVPPIPPGVLHPLSPCPSPGSPFSQNKGFCVAGQLPQLLPWGTGVGRGIRMCPVVTMLPSQRDFLNLGRKRLFFLSLRASELVGELAVGMEGGPWMEPPALGTGGARSQSTFQRTPEQEQVSPGSFPTAWAPPPVQPRPS